MKENFSNSRTYEENLCSYRFATTFKNTQAKIIRTYNNRQIKAIAIIRQICIMLAANFKSLLHEDILEELLNISIYLTIRIFVLFRKKQVNQNPFEILLFLTIIW